MRRLTRLATIATIAATSSILPAAPRADAVEIVYENGFESDADGWYPFGGAAVARTTDIAHTGATSLVATGRTANYEGPALGLTSVLAPGTTYDFTAWVHTPAAATVGLTMKSVVGGADAYAGIGTAATDGTGWSEITGSFTGDPTATAFDIYFESETLVDLYVDDVTITGPDGAVVISSVDFEDGTTGTWFQSGDPTLTVVDDGSDQVLQIADRNEDFDGLQSPTGLLTPGVEYTFSMDAKLATPGTAEIRFVMKPAYDWIGNTTIDGDGWTTVTGTFTPPGDADPDQLQAYIGTSDHSVDGTTYTYLVDDVTITGPAGEPTPEYVLATDFDDATTQGWYGRGDAAATATTDVSRSPDHGLAVTGRTDTWQGPGRDVSTLLAAGAEYGFSAWVRLPDGADPTGFNLAMVRTVGGTQNYEWISGFVAGVAGDWVELSGNYVFDEADSLELYIEADTLTDFTVDDVTIEQLSLPPAPVGVVLASDFEDGLGDWIARDAQGTPTISLSPDAHESTQAALVSDRSGQGDGIGHVVTDIMPAGGNYRIDAWVKMAEGSAGGDIWLTMRRTTDGADTFDTIGQFTGITAGTWVQVSATYRMASADEAFLYFETDYPDGTSDGFLIDDVVVTGLEDAEIQPDLTPIHDTVDFHVGVAIDSRETSGPAAELVDLHFDQLTPENHMKPEAWYDAERDFQVHPEAAAIMDFAAANGLGVYGHVLVWHSQTPAWFFEHDDGTPLTSDPADQELLRDRMRDHIFAIAEALSTGWGEFGDGNPLVAWDVVNEVISDGATDDGLRRSRWYDVLGEEYIDLAFEYADEAFNDVYAADGADRPVLLAINDYNTEQAAKRDRMIALTQRLLDRGVPVDIFGHQFHLNLSVPVQALEDALSDAEALGLQQVVSELDVTTGTPVTEALLIDQGYYYRDAFEIFRAHTDDLFSVTLWGLTDNRSWRVDNGDPLLFDDEYQAKPAYYGAVGEELPPPQRTAFVFQPATPDADLGATSTTWERLPLLPIDGDTGFELRWSTDTLTVYVDVADTSDDAGDQIVFDLDGSTGTVARDGNGDLPAEIVEHDGGWIAVAELPIPGAAEGDTYGFDVQVTDDTSTAGWNVPGTLGTLTLVEPLSYTEAALATAEPVIDGTVDAVWGDAATITTDKVVDGAADGATAAVRTLWSDGTLYVLAEVTDATPDVSGSDPWIQDSVEIFLDAGNAKNGPYRYDDTQIRINAENVTSFGTGDVDFQAARLESATAPTEAGYVVEAAISLLEYGGPGTFHGLDVQVNDGTDGARTSIHTWAEPTGTGYQTTARWGVVRLAEPAAPACDRTISNRRWGPLVVVGERVCLEAGAVVGPAFVVAGGSLVADGATMRGGIWSVAADEIVVVGADVRGPVSLFGTTGRVEIRSTTVRGGVAVIGSDAGEVVISDNRIVGGLACHANAPDPSDEGEPNRVRGRATGQCRELAVPRSPWHGWPWLWWSGTT